MMMNNVRKTSFLFICLLYFISISLYSQTDEAVSILRIAEELEEFGQGDSAISYLKGQANRPEINKHPVDQAAIFFRLYKLYRSVPIVANTDSSIYYLEKEIELIDSDSLLYHRYMKLAFAYGYSGDFKNTEKSYYSAIDYLREVHTLMDSVKVYSRIGSVKARLNKYEEGNVFIEKAINLAFKSEDLSIQYDALNRKGFFYYHAAEYDKQKALMPRLLRISKMIKDSAKISSTLSMISNLMNMSHQSDSAEYYLVEAKKYIFRATPALELDILTKLTSIQTNLGKFEEAEKNAKKMLAGYKKYGLENSEKGLVAYMFMGNLQFEKGNFKHAESYYQKTYEISKKLNSVRNQKIALQVLIRSTKQRGDFEKAFAYMEKHQIFSDSTFKDFYENKLAESEARIGLTLKEKDLETASIKLEKKQAQQTLYISLIIILGLFLTGAGWAYYRINDAKGLIESQKKIVEKTLYEKELLLKEVHHRVKNNLQIISSILAKQARQLNDEKFKDLMKDGRDRIQTMALVHKNLYQSEDLAAIGIQRYFEELSANIAASQNPNNKKIQVNLKVEEATFGIDTVIPLGLILNELLTNVYKYAFDGRKSGEVMVGLKNLHKDQYQLTIVDNGVGINTALDIRNSSSLGLSLVRGLVRQLKGNLDCTSSKSGTSFLINFKEFS